MGYLDEAIREHLDLKRRRGAPDSELRQMEDEAFGPPARPDEAALAEAEGAAEPSGNGLAETKVAEERPESPAAERTEGLGEEAAAFDEGATTIHPPPAEEEPLPEHPVVFDQSAEEGQAAEEPGEGAGEPPIESLETVEHPFPEAEDEPEPPAEEHAKPGGGVEAEPAPPEGEEAKEDDDVLADTPEFLKDAPEDDELWFEQGEPKDFDF